MIKGIHVSPLVQLAFKYNISIPKLTKISPEQHTSIDRYPTMRALTNAPVHVSIYAKVFLINLTTIHYVIPSHYCTFSLQCKLYTIISNLHTSNFHSCISALVHCLQAIIYHNSLMI